EAALAEGRAQRLQVAAARRGRGAGRPQRRPLADGAVTVDALDLDGRPHLAVELAVAVGVLHKVAIDAVHALFQVDVEQVDRQVIAAGRLRFRLPFWHAIFFL